MLELTTRWRGGMLGCALPLELRGHFREAWRKGRRVLAFRSAPAGPAGCGLVPSSSWAQRGSNPAQLAVQGQP